MDSKQNTFKSEISSIESVQGFSLKKQMLKRWIYENNYNQSYIAKRLNLSPEVFKEKLAERLQFNREQMRNLIKLMGAKEAFKVIYFPTDRERRRVFYEVFVEPLKKELRVK